MASYRVLEAESNVNFQVSPDSEYGTVPFPYESPILLSPCEEAQEPNPPNQSTTEQAEPGGALKGQGYVK